MQSALRLRRGGSGSAKASSRQNKGRHQFVVSLPYGPHYAIPGIAYGILGEANARLIAAAPTLLSELETIRDHDTEDDSEGNIVIRFNCTEWLEIVTAILEATEPTPEKARA